MFLFKIISMKIPIILKIIIQLYCMRLFIYFLVELWVLFIIEIRMLKLIVLRNFKWIGFMKRVTNSLHLINNNIKIIKIIVVCRLY